MTTKNLLRLRTLVPGLAVAAVLAAMAAARGTIPALQRVGLSPLTLAIIGGIVAAHTVLPAVATPAGPGIDFSKSLLLRFGIVLYGFRTSFQQIESVGLRGVAIDALMVVLTFGVAVLVGTRLLKLDRQTAMLVGAGSAICGAAAVMATEPVMRCQAHKVTVAVATVVIFGTIGMFLYPLLFPYLGLSQQQFGVYAGSTIHEVAQVVSAGSSVGEVAVSSAVIEKMLRVMMLAPFLLVLSASSGRPQGCVDKRRIVIPWFAVLFVVASATNSLVSIPAAAIAMINRVDMFLLAMAMAALGLRTHVSALRQAGPRPMLLAAVLFVFLTVGGFFVNLGVTRLM